MAGDRSVYSDCSKPVRKRTGSERWIDSIAAPRLHSVLTAPVTGRFGEGCEGISREFRRDDMGEVNTNEGVDKLGDEG